MTREGGRAWLTRRVVFLALLSLLLGFVTTWLLAWACAAYVVPRELFTCILPAPPTAAQLLPPTPPSVHVSVHRRVGWGCDALRMRADLCDEQPFPPRWQLDHTQAPRWTVAYQCWRAGQPAPAGVAPEFFWEIPATATVPAHVRHVYLWTEARSGWPMRSLRWWRTPPRGQMRDFHGAFEPPDWLMGTSGKKLDAALPYVPRWAGLIVDTLFFTLLWYGGIHAAGFAKRNLRERYRAWCLRRRCCLHCGYDLRGCEEPGCPECGHGRE